MLYSFVRGTPTLLIGKERALVVGDLHIGLHLKLKREGLYFGNATERLAEGVLRAYRKAKARRIVLLGDVKDRIGAPGFTDYKELRIFFEALKGMDIRIAKGNHDSGLERMMKNMGFGIPVEREVLLEKAALLHGNAWPSGAAMRKQLIVASHAHYALERNGTREKVWFVSTQAHGARRNRHTLIVAPAFNELIPGSALSRESKGYLPLLRNNAFGFGDARIYGLNGKPIGDVNGLLAGELSEPESKKPHVLKLKGIQKEKTIYPGDAGMLAKHYGPRK